MTTRPPVDASGDRKNRLTWRTVETKGLVLRVGSRSFEHERTREALRTLTQTVTNLQRILKPSEDFHSNPAEIVLVDEAGDTSADSIGQPGEDRATIAPPTVVRLDSGAPTTAVIRPTVELLVGRWFGPKSVAAPLFVDGLTGIVSADAGLGPNIREAHNVVLATIDTGRPASFIPRLKEGAPAQGADPIATSFVVYLLGLDSAETFGEFLLTFDPHQADDAANRIYHQPLGSLEASWHGFVRHRAREQTAFRALVQRLIGLLRPYRLPAAEVGVLMVLNVCLTLAIPLIIMQLIDHVIQHPTGSGYRDLAIYSIALLLVFFLSAVVGARRTYAQHWLNERIVTDLNHQLFARLQRLSHNFYARTRTSELMTTLNEELREVQEAMALVAGTGLYQALLATATAITVILLDPLLGALVLVVVPVFAVGYSILRARWEREARGLQRLHAAAEQTALENLSAHSEVKAFGLEEHVIQTYQNRHQAVFGSQLRLVSLGALFESSLHLASGVGHVVVFGFGGYQILSGTGGVTIGVLFAFAHLLPLFYEPIEQLADIGHTVEGAAAALEGVDEILEEPIAVADKPGAPALPPLAREIHLDHVSFAYGGDEPVIQDLSLTIPAGSEVAIVGPSGSGKSTVLALLTRFWDPEAGRVVYDEHDARDVTIASLRGQIGLVSQDTFIFDTSVRENIAIGRPDATDLEIEHAAQAAQLHDFITALPAGYHTLLGEHGVRMSGGQRQRLAIARALLRNPRILILDEATSALDPQTETEIQETLAIAAKGRTLISVTHRLAAVVTSDRIFVLDQGQLAEEGHHAELVKAGGLYQRLYEEQMHYLHGGGVLRQGVDIDRLRAIPLFTDLAEQALQEVANRFLLERYAAEEVVVRQGDPGDKLYTISRGQLDVSITHSGGQQHVAMLNEGDYFGEMAVLTGEPRSATVRTTLPTQLYSLAKSDFALLMDRVPGLRQSVEPTIATRRAENEASLARAAAARGIDGQHGSNDSSNDAAGEGTTPGSSRPTGHADGR